MTNDDGLSPRERELMDQLASELDPPDRVRDRVREELFRRGILRPASSRRGAWARRRGLRWLVAAAILSGVFLAGMITGSRWPGSSASGEIALPVAPAAEAVDGARVQMAGSEYAASIRALVDDSEVSSEALTAALATLRAAAEQLSRATTLDPETVSLLRSLREQDLYPEERAGLL